MLNTRVLNPALHLYSYSRPQQVIKAEQLRYQSEFCKVTTAVSGSITVRQ